MRRMSPPSWSVPTMAGAGLAAALAARWMAAALLTAVAMSGRLSPYHSTPAALP